MAPGSQACADEPIQIPGAIQPHGVLLVLDRQGLAVENVAGDTKYLLGIEPERVLGRTLSSLIDSHAEAFVIGHLGAASVHVAPIICLGVRSYNGLPALDLTLSAGERTALIELEPSRRTVIGAPDPIVQLKTLLSALHHTDTVLECCAAAAAALRTATGFDRGLAYQFSEDCSGVVIAEDADPGLDPYLGLRYPASDIPTQARELYQRNWLRVIPDVEYVPAPLRPATNLRTGLPVDMSDCALRSVSPVHLEYLRNMGVRSSMSVSIVCQNQLWGMMLLHHRAPRYVSTDLRVACETFAQILSLHVEAKTQNERSALRINARGVREEIVCRLMYASDPGAALASPDLLRYVDAAGAAVHFDGQLHTIGETPEPPAIRALIAWLDATERTIHATSQLSAEFPDAIRYAGVASGLLAVAVSRAPRHHVLWFRPEVTHTVRWAGDPRKPAGQPERRLTPRRSFQEWLEEKSMTSAPWSDGNIEAAEALRVILLETALKSAATRQGGAHADTA
jgi:light-regulated signal transduction histidine kinase (bacteriophytochrome)